MSLGNGCHFVSASYGTLADRCYVSNSPLVSASPAVSTKNEKKNKTDRNTQIIAICIFEFLSFHSFILKFL